MSHMKIYRVYYDGKLLKKLIINATCYEDALNIAQCGIDVKESTKED